MGRFKTLLSAIFSVTLLMLFINCSGPEHGTGSASLGSNSLIGSADSVAAYSASLRPLVTQNCGGCHGSIQQPLFAMSDATESHNALIQFGLVNLTNPANSRIVTKIQGGHQNFAAALATQMQTQIAAWAQTVADAGGEVPAPAVLEPTFQSISQLILIPKCVACHGATLAEDGYRYDTYAQTMTSKRENVNITTPTASKLYTSVRSGEMPEGAPNLTNEEVQTILMWIEMGAPNN